MKTLKIACLLTFFLLITKPNLAVEPLSTGELSDLCKNYASEPQSSYSLQCARYIKGFIDGAIAIDSRVASEKETSGKKEDKKKFTERAIRTRIGNRLRQSAKPENNDFCLGRPLPLSEVIVKVTKNISQEKDSQEPALYSVYRTLRSHYPCENKNK